MDAHKKFDPISTGLLCALVVLDVAVWYQIAFRNFPTQPQISFFNVGQGDATLITLPGGVQMLVDAGPDGGISRVVEKALRSTDRRIDIGIVTHPERDHFGGFVSLLDRYQFGAMIINGRDASGESEDEWQTLREKITARGIPLIVFEAGDGIRYGEHSAAFLSPDELLRESAELNDTGLVMLLHAPAFRLLLPADIGAAVEEHLAETQDIRADVLKVSHHGSKYSSSEAFLQAVSPAIAVISAGKSNRYGHPAPETLARLASSSAARVFRTDTDGTVTILADGHTLKTFVSP